MKNFVQTFTIEIPIRMVKAPYTQYPNKKDTINFVLMSDWAQDVILKDGNKWFSFFKESNTFKLTHKITGKYIDIAVRSTRTGKNYSILARYKVNN